MNNGLTPFELELLALLSEELGEVQQIIGKIIRHGLHSSNPLIEGAEANQQLLERELGDVGAAVELLMNQGVIDPSRIEVQIDSKLARISKWLHHIHTARPEVHSSIEDAKEAIAHDPI